MDAGSIAELNTFLVLDAIRAAGQATRGELRKQLGLSEASVSRIARRLLAAGIIEELPGEGTALGRTPTILRFVGHPGSVIAVDLGGTRCHGALADLAGETFAEDFRSSGVKEDAVAALLECIATLRAKARKLRMPVRAVVVGIPALIDPQSGLAAAGPYVHWDGFDLIGSLRASLKEPFEVDNDVNLAALGQAWRGEGRSVQSFVTISLGTGIGGAVVLDGHVVRGRHNAAGELGYFVLPPEHRRQDGNGWPGFEELASGPAIRDRALALIDSGMPTSLGGTDFQAADVFAAAAQGDEVGRQVVRELVVYVSVAIIGITAVVDPDRVILDGSVGRALEPWLGHLRTAVEAKVFAPPDIVISRLGPNATIIGAIARALALVSAQGDAGPGGAQVGLRAAARALISDQRQRS
jgi:glucokinase